MTAHRRRDLGANLPLRSEPAAPSSPTRPDSEDPMPTLAPPAPVPPAVARLIHQRVQRNVRLPFWLDEALERHTASRALAVQDVVTAAIAAYLPAALLDQVWEELAGPYGPRPRLEDGGRP